MLSILGTVCQFAKRIKDCRQPAKAYKVILHVYSSYAVTMMLSHFKPQKAVLGGDLFNRSFNENELLILRGRFLHASSSKMPITEGSDFSNFGFDLFDCSRSSTDWYTKMWLAAKKFALILENIRGQEQRAVVIYKPEYFKTSLCILALFASILLNQLAIAIAHDVVSRSNFCFKCIYETFLLGHFHKSSLAVLTKLLFSIHVKLRPTSAVGSISPPSLSHLALAVL